MRAGCFERRHRAELSTMKEERDVIRSRVTEMLDSSRPKFIVGGQCRWSLVIGQ